MKKFASIQTKKVSFLLHKKGLMVSLLLAIVVISAIVGSLSIGDTLLSPLEVIASLIGTGDPGTSLIVSEFRLPRILIATIAGAALALSGSILQGVVRNPLASPDMLGITHGAGLAAVAFITLFSSGRQLNVSIHYLPVAAVTGAILMAILIYILAWSKGISPVRFILIGVGLMSAAQALTSLMILLGPIYAASQATIWLTGSVNGSSWNDVMNLLPWFIVLLPLLVIITRQLNVQALGDDVAESVGHAVQKWRIALLLISTVLAGSAVAFAGAIGFVGLIAPHIARRLVGPSAGSLLPVASLLGSLLVVLADLAGRTLFAPMEVPAGVFTAAIGAPYFIYLLLKNHG
ncbi:ABC transporter integral membrane protein [Fictibacillus macauensis ZFHKF-1]|uniref:ABC transporter integral membrane protein n=1 Tax=Fictibacillus macauensis ZFHKF-1 TaxID=1196324 RepID=I8UHK0_9BACL|nr:iron ABC transporter permease [Fictibacillus macauensis]EIT86298.1 ABC transporter integral membrane protein [Fictibacillus macauensis ZFHKF-1]